MNTSRKESRIYISSCLALSVNYEMAVAIPNADTFSVIPVGQTAAVSRRAGIPFKPHE
jgi:hypothetical protein